MDSYQNDPDWDFITGAILAILGAMLVVIAIWMVCHLERGRDFPQMDTRSAKFAEKNRIMNNL